MNFTLITPFILCSLSWISVSGSGFHTVRGRPGEEVTLLISNISKYESVTFWFRLVNRTQISCISVMIRSDSAAEFCDGYGKENFEMRSNISNLFLKIKQVALSDSGLYFCGFYTSGRPIFSVIDLHVEGSDEVIEDVKPKEADGVTKLMNAILGGLIVFLVIINGVVIKVMRPPAAAGEEAQQREGLDSSDLRDAALSACSAAMRSRRPPSQREVETHVIYTASK
ncbi:uncharacterized protein [Trachinotus anak]|uniref:uncharacterized protein n=1 Tax=Trachinotus anak TaxID=443729 RepID=UPI0039F21E5C